MVNARASRALSERYLGSSPSRRTTINNTISRSGGMVDTPALEAGGRKARVSSNLTFGTTHIALWGNR